jgi:hypothetical protein
MGGAPKRIASREGMKLRPGGPHYLVAAMEIEGSAAPRA